MTSLLAVDMWTDLAEFLSDQTEARGLSWREASLQAGLDHAAISRFIRGTTPSPESCLKLAKFFNVPEDVVLKLAGHKSEAIEEELKSSVLRELESLVEGLPEDEQRKILAMVRAMSAIEDEGA